MNNKCENKHDLWEDFLDLGEKYSNEMTVPDFGSSMLRFVFKMMFDCAPNADVIKEITQRSMMEAYEWHLDEKK